MKNNLKQRKSQLSHIEPDCNTVKSGNSEAVNQMYRWQFTLKWSEPIEPKTLYTNLKPFCKEFYYQLEEGEGGYKHYQGCLSLNNKERLNTVKNIIGFNEVHLEKAFNWNALKNYCKKSDTRINGPWSHLTVWINTISDLNWWQKEVWDMIGNTSPDDRKIYWFWDEVGNIGKTAFTKKCAIELGATVLNNGSFSDIAYSMPDDPKLVIFNLPRSLECRVNYSAIECIKDGMIFSAKYESKTKYFNAPHVLVFANFEPDITSMSLDRWEIINLG